MGLASVSTSRLPEVSSDRVPFISLADANQCMRVSSALDAGTVSDLVATSRGVRCSDDDPPGSRSSSPGLGEPIQYPAQ